MKLVPFPMTLVLTLACAGQSPISRVASTPPSAAAPVAIVSAEAPRINRAAVGDLEYLFEQKLKSRPESAEGFFSLGACSGLYLNGYGLLFTMPLDLIQTPKVSPFQQTIPKEAKETTHTRKLAQLPLLKQAMRDVLAKAAAAITVLPPNEKIVVAARLFYMDWEDRAGLPSQIVVSADRESALAGKIQIEEQ